MRRCSSSLMTAIEARIGRSILRFARLLTAVACLASAPQALAAEFTIYSASFPRLAEPKGDGASGLYVDLMAQVERKTGHRFIWRFQPWARAQLSARADPNGLIANFTRTPEREALYRWVGVVGWGRYAVFVPRKSPAQNLAAMKGMTIGYLNGSEVQGVLQDRGFKKLEAANNSESNARKLHLGRIDGWAINMWTGPTIFVGEGFSLDELRVLPLNDAWDQWLAGSPQFPAEAAAQIGEALGKLKQDGTARALEAKYWQAMPGMPNPAVAKGS